MRKKKISKEVMKGSCKEYLVCLFIRVANHTRHRGWKNRLDDQYLLDKVAYPKTMPTALKLLQQLKGEAGQNNKQAVKEMEQETGLAFAQTKMAAAPDKDTQCFGCKQKGHYAYQCPNLTQGQRDKLYARKKAKREGRAMSGQNHLTAAGADEEASVAGSTDTNSRYSIDDFVKWQESMEYISISSFLGVQAGATAGVALVQPADTNIYPKETHPDKKVSFSDVTSESSVAGCDSENGRIMLDEWKLYLDS